MKKFVVSNVVDAYGSPYFIGEEATLVYDPSKVSFIIYKQSGTVVVFDNGCCATTSDLQLVPEDMKDGDDPRKPNKSPREGKGGDSKVNQNSGEPVLLNSNEDSDVRDDSGSATDSGTNPVEAWGTDSSPVNTDFISDFFDSH